MYSKRTLNLPRNALDPISSKVIPIRDDTTYNDWMNKLKEKYSDDEIAIQRRKVVNAKRDNAEYRSLKDVLGKKDSPINLNEYQNLKYGNKNGYNKLKKAYQQAK
jgi:ABC-type phosphate transport system ATPase subunit